MAQRQRPRTGKKAAQAIQSWSPVSVYKVHIEILGCCEHYFVVGFLAMKMGMGRQIRPWERPGVEPKRV
eukprot:COSAG01_NODE_3783_length_5698_cov_58.077692_2_plen_69_part_00